MLKGMEENNEHTIQLVGLNFEIDELREVGRREIPTSIMHEGGRDDVLHKIKSTIYSMRILRNYIINISDLIYYGGRRFPVWLLLIFFMAVKR